MSTYLKLVIPPFALALRTETVLGVVAQPTLRAEDSGRSLEYNDQRVPVLDFSDPASQPNPVPFVVVAEAPSGAVGITAEHIGYIPGSEAKVMSIPPFALPQAASFECAIRTSTGLFLVLSPRGLAPAVSTQGRGSTR